MTKYSFGWNGRCKVECPELDAFVADIKAVCERYGAGFRVEHEEYSSKVVLCTFAEMDFDVFTANLDDYDEGVPWLDTAKAEYNRVKDIQDESERRIREAAREEAERKQYAILKAKYEGGQG